MSELNNDYVFEGSEKRLQLDFMKSSKLRDIPRQRWDIILKLAKCEIISHQCTDIFDAYVLSESSLFVYNDQIILKTCGTTSLLLALDTIINEAKQYNGQLASIQFSRAQYLFRSQQPKVHQSFANECKFLLKKFPNGQAYILGPLNGSRIHVFVANMVPTNINQQRLEVLMFDLPTDVMNMFYKRINNNDHQRPINGKEATKLAGFETLLPDAYIDDFLFDPCGYSCNGLSCNDAYFTIHITPQKEFSFVSFETNTTHHSYDELILKICRIFRPNNLTISIHHNNNCDITNEQHIWNLDNYVSTGRTTHHFPQKNYIVSCGHFIADHFMANHQRSASPLSKVDSMEVDLDELCHSKHGHHPYNVTKTLTRPQIEKLCKQIIINDNTDSLEFVESNWDHHDVIAEIVDHLDENIDTDSLLLADLDELISRFDRYSSSFPSITPYFNITSLPNKDLIRVLNGLGVGFIVNDSHDIELMKEFKKEHITSKNMIFKNGTLKSVAYASNAYNNGIKQMIFFNELELKRLAKNVPNAELFLHISHRPTDIIIDNNTSNNNSDHQIRGATMFEAKELLKMAKKLNCNVVGLHISLGEHAGQVQYLKMALNRLLVLLKYSKEELDMNINIINLGDSFWDETQLYDNKCLPLEQFAHHINDEISMFPKNIKFISEPSKFLVSSMCTIVMPIIRKRMATIKNHQEEESNGAIYYVSEGVHTLFSEWSNNMSVECVKLTSTNQKYHLASIYGSSCMPNDIFVTNKMLPTNLQVGDYVFIRNINNLSSHYKHDATLLRMIFFMHKHIGAGE